MPPIPLVTGICSPLPSPIEFKKSDEKDELVRGILTEKKKKKKKKGAGGGASALGFIGGFQHVDKSLKTKLIPKLEEKWNYKNFNKTRV
jgi:hypothetical protein